MSTKDEDMRLKIFYRAIDEQGNECGPVEVYPKTYAYWGTAFNVANKKIEREKYRFKIACRNPWEVYHRICVCEICGKDFETIESDSGWAFNRTIVGSVPPILNPDMSKQRFRHIACPDCYEKVRSFVESLKGESSDEEA